MIPTKNVIIIIAAIIFIIVMYSIIKDLRKPNEQEEKE
jgi:uncharacterized membrane protein